MKVEVVKRMALGLILMGAFVADAASVGEIEPLEMRGEMERSLNRRLYAIAIDPSLMRRLDQKLKYRTTAEYDAALDASLAAARVVLPEVFSATNMDHAVTAMCLADERVFFWLRLDDCTLVGWIPITTTTMPNPNVVTNSLTLWLIPQSRNKTKLINVWLNRDKNRLDSFWLADVLAKGLNVNLARAVLTSQDKTKLQGRIRVSREEHSVDVTATEHLVQVEITLRPIGRIYPGKPEIRELKVSDEIERGSVDLLFWPPKEE
jgi:hypothetical protein